MENIATLRFVGVYSDTGATSRAKAAERYASAERISRAISRIFSTAAARARSAS